MVLKVHKNTVRAWLKSGLEPVDDRRPTLILGRTLSSLPACPAQARQATLPVRPALLPALSGPQDTSASPGRLCANHGEAGDLRGTCSDCGAHMYRRVAWHKLAVSAGELDVTLPQAQQRIVDTAAPP